MLQGHFFDIHSCTLVRMKHPSDPIGRFPISKAQNVLSVAQRLICGLPSWSTDFYRNSCYQAFKFTPTPLSHQCHLRETIREDGSSEPREDQSQHQRLSTLPTRIPARFSPSTRSITPIRGICSHIASPKERDAPHLVNTYDLRFDAQNFDYLIPRADGSMIVGGARQKFWHAPNEWFDSICDEELIEEAVPYFGEYMQRHFRGWEDPQTEVKKVWTGNKSLTCSIYSIPVMLMCRSHGLQRRLHAARWRGSGEAWSVHNSWSQRPWYAENPVVQ